MFDKVYQLTFLDPGPLAKFSDKALQFLESDASNLQIG